MIERERERERETEKAWRPSWIQDHYPCHLQERGGDNLGMTNHGVSQNWQSSVYWLLSQAPKSPDCCNLHSVTTGHGRKSARHWNPFPLILSIGHRRPWSKNNSEKGIKIKTIIKLKTWFLVSFLPQAPWIEKKVKHSQNWKAGPSKWGLEVNPRHCLQKWKTKSNFKST